MGFLNFILCQLDGVFFRYNYLVQFAPLDGFCRPFIVTPGIAAAYVASRCQTFAVNLDSLDAEVADGIHLLVQLEVEVIARQRLVEEKVTTRPKVVSEPPAVVLPLCSGLAQMIGAFLKSF